MQFERKLPLRHNRFKNKHISVQTGLNMFINMFTQTGLYSSGVYPCIQSILNKFKNQFK